MYDRYIKNSLSKNKNHVYNLKAMLVFPLSATTTHASFAAVSDHKYNYDIPIMYRLVCFAFSSLYI